MKINNSINEYIDILIDRDEIYSLIISAPAGLGKTSAVLNKMRKMGFIENQNYIYISGHVTPLRLFRIMYNTRSLEPPSIVIFDDVDSLLDNKVSLNLLKSALSESRGKRMVSYESTKSTDVDVGQFEFKSKVIILTNNLSNNKNLQPLLDRGIVYDFNTSPEELSEYITANLVSMYPTLDKEERDNVWGKVRRFTNEPGFSFRSLHRAFSFYKHNKDEWYQMFIRTMKRFNK